MNAESILFIISVIIFLLASLALWYVNIYRRKQRQHDTLRREEARFFLFQRQLLLLGVGVHPALFFGSLTMFIVLLSLILIEYYSLASSLVLGIVMLVLMLFLIGVNAASRVLVSTFEKGLVDALDLVQASIQSGFSAPQAIALTAASTKGRLSKELSYLANSLDRGLSIERSTDRLRGLYRSESVKLFVQSLIARSQTGADLATLLLPVNRVIRERVMLRIKLNGQLSGPRYATYFMATLPYILVPYFIWKDPNWLTPIREHPQGYTFFSIALACQALGLVWLHLVARKV